MRPPGAGAGSRRSVRTESAPRSWCRRAFSGTAAAPGRGHFLRRRRAVAGPAPARTADHALVGLDLDLDECRLIGAVGDIGLPATGTDACVLGRGEGLGALIETGPLGASVAGGAALPAALASGARGLLLLALAAEQRLRQHGLGRAKPRKLRLQRLDPVPRRLCALAQPGVLSGQGLDRGLLAPRPPQGRPHLSGPVERKLRQRRPDRSKLRKPGRQLLLPGLGHLKGNTQPVGLPRTAI